MSFFTKGARPAKMMLGEACHHFAYQWLDNVKLHVHKYINFEPNAPRGSRVMSIFTKRARQAKMMLGEASSPFCIPVASNVKYISIQNLNKLYHGNQEL